MGFTALPQCDTADAQSQYTETIKTKATHRSKTVRFDNDPVNNGQDADDSISQDLSSLDLTNNKELLFKVMHSICGMTDNGADNESFSGNNKYQPTKNNLTSDKKSKTSTPSGNDYSCSRVHRNILKRVNRKKKHGDVKNDENNNFIVLAKERLTLPNWRDDKVFNRTDVLALPKPLPEGYEEEKEATYWISKKPPHIPKAGFTTSVATPRVEELAKPMYNCRGEFVGHTHCHWTMDDRPRRVDKNPDCVNWDRLATPKPRYDQCVVHQKPLVPESALKFEATKRLHQLAVPKKRIDCGSYYLWLWNKKPDVNEKLHQLRQLSVDKTDMEDARILLRCDLDFQEGKIIERKIRNILPTIEYAFKKKARAVIIISHCGHPNGKVVSKYSLEGLMGRLTEALPDNHVVFLDNCIGAEAKALCEDPEDGHVFLLENLRFHPEELGYTINDKGVKVPCTKEAILKYYNTLMSFGDVYVNDAFTIIHEETTTNFGDPKKERCYGLNIKKELGIYNHFIVNRKMKRLVAVIGGVYNEVADIISALMGKASEILLGGEVALMFLHTVKGVDIGETECTPYHQKKIKDMMTRARDTHTVINLPADLVVENINCPGFYYTGHSKDNIDDYYQAVDIGPLTRDCYRNVMLSAELLVWYGRMGTLHDGTCFIANIFDCAYQNNKIETYLVDNDTINYFRTYCPKGKASHITEKSEVTMSFLHRKIPKSISSLSPWRRKVKKRPSKEVQISTKPTNYETPCMKMCNALDRLSIDDLDMKYKTVVIRCDFNTPVLNGELCESFRVRMAIPSIRYALQSGAHAVILVSSMGCQHGKRVDNLTLKPVMKLLPDYLHISEKSVVFVPEPSLVKVKAALKNCYPGTVLMVENINFREEEHQYRSDIETQTQKDMERVAGFCEELSSMGDVYINDTFDNLHQQSASTCGIMMRKRACGFLLKNELRYLSEAFNAPVRPILVIMGGRYSKDKITAMKSLLREIDEIIITGSWALAFLKVVNNMPTAATEINPELEKEVPTIMELALANKVRIHYPVDFVVANEISNEAKVKQLSASVGVPPEWYAVDIGDNSCSLFKQVVRRSKFIIWHGVAGIVEFQKFRHGTKTLLDIITTVTKDPEIGATSIMGGNSNLVFAHNADPNFHGVSHITTGGVACAAIIKDRCLSPISLLSAGKATQNLNRWALRDIDITDLPVLLKADLTPQRLPVATAINDLVKYLVPVVSMLQKRGARCITVVGSFGNPQGKKEEEFSLMPIKLELEKRLRQDIIFFENGVNGASILGASGGKLYMLENLLFHPEEQGWEVDSAGERVKVTYGLVDEYRRKMSHLGDVFVNDCLSSLCTCDSSVVGVSAKIKCAGVTLKNELSKFSKFLEKMTNPLLVIVGGYSGTTNMAHKMELLYDLLDQVTDVILCGLPAYTYMRVTTPAAKLESTPFDKDSAKLWPRILLKAKLNNIKFHTPVDFRIDEKVEVKVEDAAVPSTSMVTPETIPEEEEDAKMIPVVRTLQEGLGAGRTALDIGPATVEKFTDLIVESGSLVVMGPMGEFEEKDYEEGSKAILDAIRESGLEKAKPAIAFDVDTLKMLETLERLDVVSHCSLATRSSVNILRNMLLPGLEMLDYAKAKPLKKLSIDRFNISGKRVLLRLDLDIPIVGGVILDVSKIQITIPTIQYLLTKGAKSVVLMGHRGQPRGYKNAYLSLEPLAAEFARFLDTAVNFLPYPCSAKVRGLLEDPAPGSVFLMENLRFYPAEEGRDIQMKSTAVKAMAQGERTSNDGDSEVPATSDDPKDDTTNKEGDETFSDIMGTEAEDVKEEVPEEKEEKNPEVVVEIEYYDEDEEENEEEENDESIAFADPENLDRLMYEKMAPKTNAKFQEELSECGDIFVNDNVTDLQAHHMISMSGMLVQKRMCGLRVRDVLARAESDDVYKWHYITYMTPAPKEGETDDLK